jgi:hypothetical protein
VGERFWPKNLSELQPYLDDPLTSELTVACGGGKSGALMRLADPNGVFMQGDGRLKAHACEKLLIVLVAARSAEDVLASRSSVPINSFKDYSWTGYTIDGGRRYTPASEIHYGEYKSRPEVGLLGFSPVFGGAFVTETPLDGPPRVGGSVEVLLALTLIH